MKQFFSVTLLLLDDREWRLIAAAVVEMLGRGGQARLVEVTGMSRNTLIVSVKELVGKVPRLGHYAGSSLFERMLGWLGYSLQANAKVTKGAQHADRGNQFRYINNTAAQHLESGQPVISVDCKNKKLVGDYANCGKE